MECSNCGMDIPFDGKVCPYCNADKSRDQHVASLTATFAVIGAVLGFVIHYEGGAMSGVVIGAFVGLIVGLKTRPSGSGDDPRLR